MKQLITIALALALAACNQGGGSSPATGTTTLPIDVVQPGPETPEEPADPGAPGPGPQVPGQPDPEQVTHFLRVYSLSKTEAPVNGWSFKTYTATGSCATHEGKTYCWDDGVKTITIPVIAPLTYTYFGVMPGGGIGFQNCHGGCVGDYMTTPRVIDGALAATITTATVNQIFSQGSTTDLDCVESAGVLNCGSVSIQVVP